MSRGTLTCLSQTGECFLLTFDLGRQDVNNKNSHGTTNPALTNILQVPTNTPQHTSTMRLTEVPLNCHQFTATSATHFQATCIPFEHTSTAPHLSNSSRSSAISGPPILAHAYLVSTWGTWFWSVSAGFAYIGSLEDPCCCPPKGPILSFYAYMCSQVFFTFFIILFLLIFFFSI